MAYDGLVKVLYGFNVECSNIFYESSYSSKTSRITPNMVRKCLKKSLYSIFLGTHGFLYFSEVSAND